MFVKRKLFRTRSAEQVSTASTGWLYATPNSISPKSWHTFYIQGGKNEMKDEKQGIVGEYLRYRKDLLRTKKVHGMRFGINNPDYSSCLFASNNK